MAENAPAVSESLLRALQAFANATGTPAEQRRLLEEYPELLGDAADAVILDELQKRRGAEESIRIFESWRALFARCRAAGLDAAFGGDPLEDVTLDLVESVHAGGSKSSILAALAQATLQRMDERLQPVTAAICRLLLADTLLEMAQGERATNVDAALTHFTEALPVVTEAGLRQRWLDGERGLARAYLARAELSGNEADLEQGLASLERLGWTLLDLYQSGEDVEAVDEAVRVFAQVLALLPAGHPSWPMRRFHLALAHNFRFRALGERADIESAIAGVREALGAPGLDPDRRLLFLSDLGLLLHDRYAAYGAAADLDEAIASADEALALATPATPRGGDLEGKRGMYLHSRAALTGSLADEEAAIDSIRGALAAQAEGSEEWVTWQDNLSVALRARFDALGEFADIDAAIEGATAALVATPRTSPSWARRQMNLGVARLARFEVSARVEDVDAAIAAQRAALEAASAGAPAHFLYLAELGAALRRRFELRGDPDDLRQAAQALQEAVASRPENPETAARWSANLGIVSLLLFRATHDLELAGAAEEALLAAVRLAPEGSRSRRSFLLDLGTTRQDRYELTGDAADVDGALAAYALAWDGIEIAQWPDQVLAVGRAAGRLLLRAQRWQEAAAALERALQALELLYEKQLLGSGREGWLAKGGIVYRNAAYALARAGRLRDALTWLDRGRARGLSDALQRDRAELERLRLDHPEAYAAYAAALGRLHDVDRLERATLQTKGGVDGARLREMARAAAEALRAAVQSVRAAPGFEDFLAHAGFGALEAALATEPGLVLVYVAVCEVGGLALILGPTASDESSRADVVWLDALQEGALHERVTHWLASYYGRAEDPARWHAAVQDTLAWLGAGIVAPLEAPLRASAGAALAIVPCGLLALLPLHAAWSAHPGAGPAATPPWPVSLAPSARALAFACRLRAHAGVRTLVAVDEPRPVPGAASLPNSSAEIDGVASFFGDTSILRHEQASRAAALAALPRADVLHLSCHGVTDVREPLRSALLMAGGEPLSVRDLLDLGLPGARLAVLSACETGMIGIALPDEVVGLPTALARAGVAGVVASLWAVPERSTALFMERFYGEWLRGGAAPAAALLHAQQWLRGVSAADLAERFRAERDRPDAERRMARDAAREAWLAFAALEPQDRPFQHPVYWAAFAFTGA